MKSRETIVILGAGITGLVSAYYLSKKYKVILIEKETFIGGSARSFEYKDFILDYGPHKIYTELPGIMREIRKICPLLKVKKKNSIYLQGNFFDFPLKISQVATKMPLTALQAGFDIILKPFSSLPDNSYENYLVNRFGRTLYNLSFKDYAWKVWNSNPQELDKELAKRRVAISGIFQLIKGVLFKDTKQISAEYFYYPEKGIKQLIDSLAKKIQNNKGKILTNTKISEIKLENNRIKSLKIGKKKIKPDYVISTIPLNSLVDLMNFKELKGSKSGLSYQNLNIIYFILNKQRALKDCWIFFPEKKFIFQRISEQKSFSPYTSPENKTVLMVETTKSLNKEIIQQIIKQLEGINLIKKEEIKEYFIKTIENAYPIYKKGFFKYLNPIISKLDSIDNFYLLGRQGLFNYNNMDQCWDMAMKVSDQIKDNKSKEDWQSTKRYFESYRIVD